MTGWSADDEQHSTPSAHAAQASSSHASKPSRDKGKGKALPEAQLGDNVFSGLDGPEHDSYNSGRTFKRQRTYSPPSSPEPRIPRMSAPISFSAPLRTSLDMPIRGTKEAPKTFYGKYSEVIHFIEHYDQLLVKCRVTDDEERCHHILNYCTTDVQNVIRAMEP